MFRVELREKIKTVRKLKGKSLMEFPNDYFVIDIETTGLDPYYDSIIEIAALKVVNNEVVDAYNSLVYYGGYLSEFIIELTGITNKMLATAPKIIDVLEEFSDFIGDGILVAHNANFDINFIYDKMESLLNESFSNSFVDTYRVSRRVLKNQKKYSLSRLVNDLNLPTKNTHRALDDCYATNELFNYLLNHCRDNNVTLDSLKKKPLNPSDITTENTDFDEEHVFFDATCVFTGTLSRMRRADAMQLVVDKGGKCEKSVTKRTNFLILGSLDYSSNIKGDKSKKWIKAESCIASGSDLKILSEEVFYELILED